MRIKAICIPAPLSFPVPFIYPSAAPPQPNPPSTLTAPFHSSDTKLASMVVVRKKIDKNITSTHFIVTSSDPSLFPVHSFFSHQILRLPSVLSFFVLHLFPTFCSVIPHLIFHIKLKTKQEHHSSVQILCMNYCMFYQNDVMPSCCCCRSSDIIINVSPGPSLNTTHHYIL